MTQLQRARLAVFVVFTIAGASVTTWAAHIPTVEKDLAISHAEIGTALLFFGGGAVLSMQVTGFLVDRIGSKGATLLALAALGIGVTTPGLATDLLSLSITLFIFGFGLGATDIAMNAHAVVVERVYNRPILSAFHAFWSIGGLLGAILGGTMVGLDILPYTIATSGKRDAKLRGLNLIGLKRRGFSEESINNMKRMVRND